MPRLLSGLLMSLGIASSATAVTMDWTPIGDPGNPAHSTPFFASCGSSPIKHVCGSVAYAYSIGTYEVLNAQYSEFLNAVAAFDSYQLYNPNMGIVANSGGGITRSGTAGSYTYSPIPGRENMPANFVSYWDTLRFVNWMENGQPVGAQGPGTTETGSYTLNGTNPANVQRNPGATLYLTSEDEWYKAAYYDAATAGYFSYPTGSNAEPACARPTAAPNTANCRNAVGDVTSVGSYPGAASPYGVYDLTGNVAELMDTFAGGTNSHITRGAYYTGDASQSASFRTSNTLADTELGILGFRLAMIPEPSSGLLVIGGLLGLAGWRRVRA